MKTTSIFAAVLCGLITTGAVPLNAAELDRTVIPLPEPKFEGKIGETYIVKLKTTIAK